MIVTIITVCRNHAKELERTIRSVESQTWQEKEYLVIDGASTDDTLDVIKAHEASITRWVSEPDQGIYDAMNKGVRMAQGEWVIFMNAGDTFASDDTLQRVFGSPQDADVIYGDVIKEEGGKRKEESGKRKEESGRIKKAEAPRNAHRMFYCHQSYLSGKTFRQLDFPVANFDTQGVSNRNRSAGLYDNIQVIRETDNLWEQVRLLPRLYFTYLLCKIRGK